MERQMRRIMDVERESQFGNFPQLNLINKGTGSRQKCKFSEHVETEIFLVGKYFLKVWVW